MKFHWSGHIRDFLLTLFKKKSSFIFYYKGLSLKRCMSVSSFCLKSSVRFLVVARNQTPALTSKKTGRLVRLRRTLIDLSVAMLPG